MRGASAAPISSMLYTLSETRDRLMSLCSGINTAQAESRLDEASWSISEIVEHLAITERGSMIGVKRALSQPEASPALLLETIGKSELIQTRIPAPAKRVSAPDIVLPSGRFKEWPGALRAFEEARANSIHIAATADHSFETRVISHPILGPLTLSQWFHFIAAHTERHARQIEAVLAHEEA